ncbi:MAG: hypothetical protein HQL91_11740 [Magnetococcales bacterium]|nr:hypothetical protein [Magnetococcales bacterium]
MNTILTPSTIPSHAQSMREAVLQETCSFWTREGQEWLFFGAVTLSPQPHPWRENRPAALLIGGYDETIKVLNVVEAEIHPQEPDQIIADVIALQARYDCRLWVAEKTPCMQRFQNGVLRCALHLGVPTPVKTIPCRQDRWLNIQSLQPQIAKGQIRFHSSQTHLLEQLRRRESQESPDIGLVALEILWRTASRMANRSESHPVPIPARPTP